MLSQKAYAAHRRAKQLPGGTLHAVQEAIAASRIPVEPDGMIDPAAADSAWDRNTDHLRRPHTHNGHSANGHATTLIDAKTQEALERTRGLKLANDVRSGQLVEVADLDQFVSRIVVQARTQFLGTASRLKMRCPNLAAADLAEVDALIREVLTELADDAERGRHDLTGGRDVERSTEALGAATTNGGGTRRGGSARATAASRGANRVRESPRPSRAGRAPGGPRPAGAGEGADRSAPGATAVMDDPGAQ